MDGFFQDLKYGLRMLVKRPGFTLVAVLSLTLGIGANTTIFTIAKALFLQTVPVKDPATLIVVYASRQHGKQQFLPGSYLNNRDYRDKNDVFSGLSVVIPSGGTLVINGKETGVFAPLVNGNFFDVVGVQPALGRGFRADEDESPGAHPVAVLSYGLWNRQFGGDSKIVGQTIRINTQDYTVIGVMPKEFHDIGTFGNPDVYIPMAMHDQLLTGRLKTWFNDRSFGMAFSIGRLKPGVTFQQADSSMHTLAAELEREYPNNNSGRGVMLMPINDTVIPPQQHSDFFRAGTLMGIIVGLVLLIACANVANLLFARATHRQREIAIRQSMGASRNRLLRQLLTESFTLAMLAGAFGIACAFGAKRLIAALLPAGTLPDSADLSVDGRVLLFTLGLSLIATLLFGLMPALQSTRGDRLASLRDRTDAPTGSTRWYGLRGMLVMLQVALSLVALVGAGLFIHSLRNAQQIDPGFDSRHVLSMFINLGAEKYPQARAEQFFQEVKDRVRALPMVADASFADAQPMGAGAIARTMFTTADNSDPAKGKLEPIVVVQPGFFSAAGMTLIRGRDFTDQDTPQGAMVAIVNEAAAQQFWPGENPVGKHVTFLGEKWDVNVVGVVNTAKFQTVGEPPQPAIYMPLKQQFAPALVLWVRTKGDPKAAVASVRSVVQSMDSSLPIRRVRTGDEILDQSLSAPRLGAELLGGFGFLALALAAMGTYGVMSYSVSQRTRELGIRMALGAQRSDVLRLILTGGMAMVAVGIAIGFGLSFLLTRSMNSLLYGIGLFDAPSFLATSVLLILTALAACSLPARRAARVDPMVALRYE
jgi:putative ABC transport system permease protein